jgi:hypothetical protein
MDKEKKIKLDELPDSGSSPEVKITPIPKKSKPDPRMTKLKGMDDSQRSETLALRWHFDRYERKWGWLICLVFLFFLQTGAHMKEFDDKRELARENTDGISEIFSSTIEFDVLMKNPILLAIFIPFFFKLKIASGVHFDITFYGIETVNKIVTAKSQSPHRVLIKWDDITHVEKSKVKDKEILIVSNLEGPAGEMIWDIDEIKKKVIRQVLSGLVSNKNAFRIFIEKDVA